MNVNLTKREFLQLCPIGGFAAATGLLTGTEAEARSQPPEHDLPSPEENVAELAQSLATISYIAALAFVIGALVKIWRSKLNPTQSAQLIAAVWASI